jgi:small subunit ribosomal protein S15
MQLTKDHRQEIAKQHGESDKDTGSAAVQIALFTERINHITSHLNDQKKDESSARALLKLVGKRRRLLHHLQETDIVAYRALIEKLGLRK